VDKAARSVSSDLGYLLKSSLGPNWVGFTKIVATTANGGTRSSLLFEGDAAAATAAAEAPASRPAHVRAKPVPVADTAPPPPAEPKPYVVEAIRGAKRAEERVR
jgi:hypothetical protein